MVYPDPSVIGRVSELAQIGALRAAAAFASVLGREMRAGEPRPRAAAGAWPRDESETGVIFEMQGSMPGLIALLLPRSVCESAVAALCSETDVSSAAGYFSLAFDFWDRFTPFYRESEEHDDDEHDD